MDRVPVVDAGTRVELLRGMILIRAFENAITTVTSWPGPEMSAGREGLGVAVCAHLSDADSVTAARLPVHWAVARGMSLDALARAALRHTASAGQAVKPAGPAGTAAPPRSGTPEPAGPQRQLFDPPTRFTSVETVAECYPQALGQAYAFRRSGVDSVAVAVVDAETSMGLGFTEAIGLAEQFRLPLLFVIESPEATGSSERGGASSAGDPEEVYAAAARAVNAARAGDGPTAIEAHPDPSDPVQRFARLLISESVLDAAELGRIEADAEERVAGAVAAALQDLERFSTHALTSGHGQLC